jgi:hypothetical protein
MNRQTAGQAGGNLSIKETGGPASVGPPISAFTLSDTVFRAPRNEQAAASAGGLSLSVARPTPRGGGRPVRMTLLPAKRSMRLPATASGRPCMNLQGKLVSGGLARVAQPEGKRPRPPESTWANRGVGGSPAFRVLKARGVGDLRGDVSTLVSNPASPRGT